ncbi:ABC transporter permease [Patescibacteria group bacterium]|nr:ABC transporter permease [Patescibacteria group bacterium]MCL5409643.1 ABC transporter permease [Patescibacteria group bacterium]
MVYKQFVLRNIRRTPYQALAALMVMFLTFLVISVFLIVAVGSQEILTFYEGKPQAIAFFKDGTTDKDVQAIENALTLTGKITKFKYVSKEEALQIYRDRNKNNPLLLELVTANILPASLEINTKTPEDLKDIATIVQKEPVVEEVVFPEDVVASLTSATHLIRLVGGTVVAFLVIFSTLIILMIIGFKIRIKRDEIETMRLLGASNWFIRIPYILEGLAYASGGAFLGWGLSFLVLWYFQPIMSQSLGEVSQVIFPISWIFIGGLLGVELAVAAFVGLLGSYAAVRRYLHI